MNFWKQKEHVMGKLLLPRGRPQRTFLQKFYEGSPISLLWAKTPSLPSNRTRRRSGPTCGYRSYPSCTMKPPSSLTLLFRCQDTIRTLQQAFASQKASPLSTLLSFSWAIYHLLHYPLPLQPKNRESSFPTMAQVWQAKKSLMVSRYHVNRGRLSLVLMNVNKFQPIQSPTRDRCFEIMDPHHTTRPCSEFGEVGCPPCESN